MIIIGTGVDIVEIDRIHKLRAKGFERFCNRYFSNDEIQYCEDKALASQHYAGKFAAKEAIVKAMQHRVYDLIELKDIVVCNDNNGNPKARLHGKPKRRAEMLKITDIHISISHCKSYAVAMAILTGGD